MADYIIQKAIDRKDMSAKALAAMEKQTFDLQPKYDGCHLVVKFMWDADGGCTVSAESATGEIVRSCDHIITALDAVFDITEDIAFCGEVWVPGTPFPEISGAFRRHSPQPQLKFAPFDIVQLNAAGELVDPRPYSMRVTALKQAYRWHPALIRFESSPFLNMAMAESYAAHLKFKLGGYDGAIMHDLNAPYKPDRCRAGEVIKVKPLLEFDLLVLGVELAKGEKTGKNTGALVVRYKDGKPVRVSTGMTQADIDLMHEHPMAWQGKIIRVEAMDETADGKLREPRFKGVRHDKLKPDY